MKKKKMKDGGEAKKPASELDAEAMAPLVQSDEHAKQMASAFGPKKKYAEGGEVSKAQQISDSFAGALGHAEGGQISDDDLVMRIMKKKYSHGGQVANDTGTGQEADKLPNQFDDLVLRDDMEFSYTGANSGDELGNAGENERREDIVSRIMNSQKKKDKNPKLG